MGYEMNRTKKGHKAVFAIFDDRVALERAVDSLKATGFRNADISVLMRSEGTTTDATGGALAGGAFGWLVGAGALAIPGVGAFIAAGPIMSAVAGAGIGGTIGGVAGGLIGLGIPEYEAKRFENYVKEGGMLISIHVDDSAWAEKAKDILSACDGRDISVVGEEHAGDGHHTGHGVLPGDSVRTGTHKGSLRWNDFPEI